MNFLGGITMMVMLHGRERTRAEFANLLSEAAFTQPRIVRTTSPFVLLEAGDI